MKKTHYYQLGVALAAGIAFISAPAFGASTTQSRDPTLTQAKSCAEVEGVFKEYFNANRYGGQFGPLKGGVMMNDSATREAIANEGGMGGGGANFSATNTQKSGVDEPDIIKNDGKYIYYMDAQFSSKVHIVAADTNGKEEYSISLPAGSYGSQLYLAKGKLVVIGTKNNPAISYMSNMISRDQKTMVIVYDVTNPKSPKLLNAYEYDGYVNESRLIDNNKLVLVTAQYMTWGPVYMMRDKAMSSATSQTIKPEDFSFKARDLLPTWTKMSPSTITRKGVQTFRTAKTITQVDCTNVLYKKPDPKSPNQPMYGQSLTSIITFELDAANTAPTIKTIIGNSAQVHVTRNTLYLTAPSYVPTVMSCPINARCMMPMWSQGNYTTIHQFSIAGLGYNYSTAVKGSTYSQYNMDDSNGTLRIVTSDRANNINKTNVYTVSSQGKVLGKLENIAPGEQSYGVRFIDNLLYLVTYRQIDPLFVVNLADASNLKIIGELKMPGYSTYLHPYGPMQGTVQYLVGLGYNTTIDANGNERQGGVKIDLYKADFSKKDAKGNIEVTQAWTKTFGEQGSQSEALTNPRMFVFNSSTKELVLPIVMAKTEKTQQCNIIYGRDGNELRKECYPQETALTQFAGIKIWKLSPTELTEKVSLDYKDILKSPYNTYTTSLSGTIDPWIFSSIMARVGYIGNKYYFVSNQFAHFFQENNLKGVRVDFPYVIPNNPETVTPLKAQG